MRTVSLLLAPGFVLVLSSGLAGCGADTPPPDDEGGPTGDPAPSTRLLHPIPRAPALHPAPDEPAPDEPAACASVEVVNTGGELLNVRPQPSTAEAPLGTLAAGEVVPALGVVEGEEVEGDTTWYQVDAGRGLVGYVSGAFASCVDPSAPPPPPVSPPAPEGFLLPLACGTTTTITQGNNSAYSHTGKAAYAFDFGLPRHTPLVAVDDGTVIAASDQVQPGDPCWNGGGQECANTVNYVLVQHADGTASLYMHLDAPTVNVGDAVLRGQQVGWSGGTGWSTGPHAHVQRQELCGSWWCQSVPTSFTDVPGDGVPQTGDTVTSQNCD